MNNLNTVLPNGTFGVAVSLINDNFSLIVNAINSLENASTKSKGIHNYGFVPSTTTIPNAVSGDWCMVLREGNTFPADIWTYNGTSWSKGGTWNPEGIDLTQYAKTSDMNAAIEQAISQVEIETVDNLNEETASGHALDAHQGFVLAGQISEVQDELEETADKVYFEQIREISFAKTNGRVWNYTAAKKAYTASVSGYIGSTSYINVANVQFVMLLFAVNSTADPHCFFTDDSATMVGSKLYNDTGDYKRFKVPEGATRLYISSSNSALCGVKFVNRFDIKDVIPDMKNVTDDLGESLTFGSVSYCDFAVTDEEGNDILRLQNGHIRTKNFNSEDVETNKYTKLEGKHLVIIGDSISSYSGYSPSGWRTYYPQGEVNSPSNTYWYQLAVALKMTYNNCAYSSSRVTGDSTITTTTGESGGCPGCSDLRMNATSRDGKTPDVILVYMGVNDWAQGAPIGNFDNNASIPAEGNLTNNFSGAYALMLKKLRTLYPLARVFCCTIPSSTRRGDTPPFIGGDATIPLQTYNDTIVNVAHIMGCDVIDLAACGINYLSGGLVTVDCDSQGLNGLHPNILGHSLMYNKILTEIMAKY